MIALAIIGLALQATQLAVVYALTRHVLNAKPAREVHPAAIQAATEAIVPKSAPAEPKKNRRPLSWTEVRSAAEAGE